MDDIGRFGEEPGGGWYALAGTAASIGAGEQVATTLAIGVAARGGRAGDVVGVEVGGEPRFR